LKKYEESKDEVEEERDREREEALGGIEDIADVEMEVVVRVMEGSMAGGARGNGVV